MDYTLIDSGRGYKLERFGKITLIRPCAQAVWSQRLPQSTWDHADALFEREEGNRWQERKVLPDSWTIAAQNILFKLKKTEFGHLGIFPEQMPFWSWIQEKVILRESPRVLNLFAYSGGSTLAAAQKGARVCHLDASKGMVSWAKENAFLNGLDSAPIRWIVDDVRKFLKREIKRKSVYDAIILDPPTFGRGPSGEVFRIETDLPEILTDCVKLLSEKPLFFLFSCHTPGYTPLVLKQWLSEFFSWPFETGEMFLKPNSLNSGLIIPSGTYARWCHEF